MGNRLRAARERGAVLALVAATLLLVLISGAIAVDLSALDRQGQTLQNTVDAAALAGVAEWTENGDRWATTELVEDLIAQNGIVLADGVSLDIEFPSPLELSIELSDTEPDVFLSGVIGMDGTLRRGAIARLETCDEGCDREIEVPEPFSTIALVRMVTVPPGPKSTTAAGRKSGSLAAVSFRLASATSGSCRGGSLKSGAGVAATAAGLGIDDGGGSRKPETDSSSLGEEPVRG